MFDRLKQTFSGDDEESVEIVEWRLAFRSFVDDHGWTTLQTWSAVGDEPLDDADPPISYVEFLDAIDRIDRPGYYKLFPVDENKRLRTAEYSEERGTEEDAKQRQQLLERLDEIIDQIENQ